MSMAPTSRRRLKVRLVQARGASGRWRHGYPPVALLSALTGFVVAGCGAGAAPTLAASATQTPSQRASTPAPHAPDHGSAGASWPLVVELDAPPPLVDCGATTRDPALRWQLGATPEPVLVRPTYWSQAITEASRVTPPVALPADLEKLSEAATRTSVQTDTGWLIAMDRGEADGSGLYWVPAGTAHAQRLDAPLAAPVRWIARTPFGIVGVAGLCAGDPCVSRTAIYKLLPNDGSPEWQLVPIAVVPGCPAAIGMEADGEAVLVAAGCGGLDRLHAGGAMRVASWPSHLLPREVARWPGARGADSAYLVSFGHVLGRFTNGAAEWYVPRRCPRLERGPTNECRCALGEEVPVGDSVTVSP